MPASPTDSDAHVIQQNIPSPDFDQLDQLLIRFGALQGAAELHGFLSGQLAGGKRLSRGEWLRAASEQANLGELPDQASGDLLFALYRDTLQILEAGEYEFQPLLPEDDQALGERINALGAWCQGFLAGFGLAVGNRTDGEIAETLRDFAAVAQIGVDDDETDSESDLFAVIEYIRLAAIDLFFQHQPQTPPPATDSDPATSPADLFNRRQLH
jgi:yecA family protein